MSESRSASGVGEGTIRPARFIKPGSDEGGILECAAGNRPLGVSFRDTRRSDYVDPTASPGVHALAGEPVAYYTAGARCWLQISGTVTDGDRLGATTGGAGITVTADGDHYGATALANGTDGQLIPVVVDIGQRAT